MSARASVALAVAFGLFASSSPARGEPAPEVRAAATTLFDDARRLMKAGDYAAACPKLEEAQRIDPGIGTLFNLADCLEHIGRTASAWSTFREVAAEAAEKGQPDREKTARARLAALEPKLMRLKVVVADAAKVPGLVVERDGVVLGSALFGAAVPVDPGAHVIAAKAPGKKAFQSTANLAEAGAVATVEVPPFDNDVVASVPVVAAPSPSPLPMRARPWQAPFGIALTGVGVVAVGIGTAIGFVAKSSFGDSNANAACGTDGLCTSAGQALRTSAVQKGNVATIVFVSGAVVAAGGVVLWITAPAAPNAPEAAFGLTPSGFVLRRSF